MDIYDYYTYNTIQICNNTVKISKIYMKNRYDKIY